MAARTRTSLVDILIVIGPPVLLCVAGLAAAYFLFLDYKVPWTQHVLPAPPEQAASILHLEINDTHADPTGDTLYVSSRAGTVYAYTLFEEQWQSMEPPASWKPDYTTDCAPGWPVDEQSNWSIWSEPPPVEKAVIDSAGIRWEHAMAIDVRCYVLAQDGSLEVWVREDNASMGVMPFIYFAPVLACGAGALGLLAGGIIVFIRSRRRGAAQAQA